MFLEILRSFLQGWRLHKLTAARSRLHYLLENTPRYWRSMATGGGAALQLGSLTREQAVKVVTNSGAVIAYIDNDEACIFVRGDLGEQDDSAKS